MNPNYLGWWYATGPDKPFAPSDPAFNIHRVVADDSATTGCVTIRNACGQTFALSRDLIAKIGSPAGMIWDSSQRAYVPLAGASC